MGVALFSFFISCQKEVSVEYGSPAKGSLQSSAGDCLPKSVGGSYIANKAINDSNYIEVTVNVTSPGPYTIFTDSINGYSFKATGTFANTGSNTVRLKGSGKPVIAGVDNFTVSFDTSFCDIAVTVLPAGSSGGPAAFTMLCTSFTPGGTYFKDTTLTAANNVSLQVNVTTPGTYTITTNTVNGYSFSTSGTFGGTGNQTITLQGTGKPLAAGTDNFIATAGTATCNFSVTVTAAAPGCSVPTRQGTYTAGTALTAANTVTFTHTYATAATYNVSTTTANGYTFGPSSYTATAGVNTITLTGTGTPSAAGTNNFTVNFNDGTATCPFSVTVLPAPNNDYFPTTTNSYWTYNYDAGAADTFKVTSSGVTQTINGNSYIKFEYTTGSSTASLLTEYYRKTAAEAFYRADDTAIYPSNVAFTQPRLDVLFLKNVLATGDSLVSDFPAIYTDPGTGQTFNGTFRVNYKVVSTTGSLTVNGKTFTNVYHLQEIWQFGQSGVFGTFTGDQWHYYYVKGVGLVKSNDSDDFQDIRYWQVN